MMQHYVLSVEQEDQLIGSLAVSETVESVFPIFVVALALTAFANGLWMTVGVFWKYTFYQFDYQRYAFSALVRNQMFGNVYDCGQSCQCILITSLAGKCLIDGVEPAERLGHNTNNNLSYVCPCLMKLTTGVIGFDHSCNEIVGVDRIVIPQVAFRDKKRFASTRLALAFPAHLSWIQA